jgi:hypothetical protein
LEPGIHSSTLSAAISAGHAEIRVKGKALSVPAVQIDGRTVISTGRWLRIAAVREEELLEGDSVSNPDSAVSQLRESGLRADLFTFAQRLPDVAPRYDYHMEWENAAVLPITSYSRWWKERTEYSIRKGVNKARRLGVVAKVAEFDDRFAEGIWRNYNETPVRQGRAFWHYGQGLESIKSELGTYLDRSVFLGAYCEGELIGSMKLTYVGPTATIMHILSAQKHFDKRPNNALIAKAVEVCEAAGKSHLIYGSFVYYDPDSSLTEFKRRNGFEQVQFPRFYIPLNAKGRIALSLRLQRGVKGNIPQPVFARLLKARSRWYAWRAKSTREAAQAGAASI